MSRRKGIIGFLAYAAALLDPRLQQAGHAQEQKYLGMKMNAKPTGLKLVFEDDGFRELVIHYKGEEITITAKEVMEALRTGATKE